MDASESATKQRQASGSALMIVRMVIMMMMMTVNRMSVTIRIAGTRFEQGRRQGG